MPLFHSARVTALSLLALSVVACSDRSPVGPDATSTAATQASDGTLAARPGLAAGAYLLTFWHGGAEVTTLQAGGLASELTLKAHVDSGTGAPAQSGEATFEYCSYRKLPPNDITRAHEAPLQACADGLATWKRVVSVELNALGDAYGAFGTVERPRTVGFRFTYAPRGGSVAKGASAPRDFTW